MSGAKDGLKFNRPPIQDPSVLQIEYVYRFLVGKEFDIVKQKA